MAQQLEPVVPREIEEAVLALNARQRGFLAEILIRSLDHSRMPDTKDSTAWAAELDRRYQDIVDGSAPLSSAEAALARIDLKLDKIRGERST